MRGVIAAGNQLTAQAGADILARGGNAVDAAVAAAFVSFISEIGLTHPGGSGIAQVFDPGTASAQVYDFFSNTPGLGGQFPEKLDFHEVTIDFGPATQSFHLGRGSVAVPGSLAGLCQLAAERGSLPLGLLLEPAIRLARHGAALDKFQADTCLLLEPLYTHTPEIREIFEPDGRMVEAGEKIFLPQLARTLEELAAEGSEYCRHGRFAELLLEDQRKNGGLVTQLDLDEYRVERSDPIAVRYRDHQVLMPPPCSTGGVLTAFSLLLLSAFEPYDSDRHADSLRLLAETMAATSRARRQWDHWLETLDPARAVSRFLAARFIEEWACEVEKGLSGRRAPRVSESEGPADTTQLSVVDAAGTAVSLTTSAGESAGFVVPGTGVIANNLMGEADLHPKGFHTRPAGQRIPTMMTPTLVLRDGRIRFVLGTGGSTRIRSAILQVLTNLIDRGMPLQAAVDAPRIHLEDGVLQCEKEIPARCLEDLAGWGWKVNHWPQKSIYFGGTHSVEWKAEGELVGAGDSRRAGAVAWA